MCYLFFLLVFEFANTFVMVGCKIARLDARLQERALFLAEAPTNKRLPFGGTLVKTKEIL